MMPCSNCGYGNPDSARFCGQCGRQLVSPPTAAQTRPAGTPTGLPSGDAMTVTGLTPPGSPTPAGSGPRPAGGSGPLTIGQAFGPRYHIIRMLGAGGMGAVYQAWDAELGVAVALKIIRPEATVDTEAAREVERRFKRELLLARQVTHKNVVRIHDLGEIDGIKYITMPYVQGADLARILKTEGRLPVPKALSIAKQIAGGLQAAHEVGVVHRDLKPANVMIEEDHALIMDFGIARSVAPGATMATMAGQVIGTIEYMAPEQARGEAADQRADIYAFGLIFYDMLFGPQRAAGTTNPVAELMKRMQQPLPAPRTVDPQVPEAVDRIITRCAQVDPAARFQTTAELVAELERLGPDGQPLAPGRSRRSKLLMLAAANLLMLALLTGTWWLGRRTATPATPEERAPVSVLIANFDNQANDPVFEGALEQALILGLEGASFVTTFPRRDAARLATQIQPGATLDQATGRLVSAREGIRVVLAGSIAARGTGYTLTVQVVDPLDGRIIDTASESAGSKAEVLEAVGDLAVKVRRALGDTAIDETTGGRRETVTAGSLEAMGAYLSAQELAREGRDEDAVAHYNQALQHDPNFGRAYSGLATSLTRLGRRAEAEAAWDKALSLMDRMTEREKYRTLGAYYLGVARNYEQAVENYSALVRQFPADTAGHNNLAVALFSSLQFGRAMESGRRALEIYPKSVLYRTNYALYAMYAGDFATASTEAEKVIAQSPETFKAYLPVAVGAIAAGTPEAALAAYDRMAGAGPRGASLAALGRADLAIYQGRFDEAIGLLEPAMAEDERQRNNTGRVAKLVALGEAHAALGDRGRAFTAFRQALDLSPREAVVVPASVLYARTGRFTDAERLSGELARQLQPQQRAYGAIIEGQLALVRRDWVAAFDAFRRATRLADLWYARFGLGVAYVEAGDFAAALSELELCQKRQGEAVALFLDDFPTYRYLVPLRYWLGRAREGLGMSGPAQDDYRAYLALRGDATSDPLAADARKRLGSATPPRSGRGR